MEKAKDFVLMIVLTIIAFLEPVHNAMGVLCLLFGADLFFGIIADVIVNDKRFSFKKFIFAVLVFLIYHSVITAIFTVGVWMKDGDLAMRVVKAVTYIFVYFLSTNTLRNITLLFPNNRVFAFLDEFISFEFAKRIPALGEFLKKNKKYDNTTTGESNEPIRDTDTPGNQE